MAVSKRRSPPTSFEARVQKIGINPYVRVPPPVLHALFEQAKKSESPIPVKGTLNGKSFRQTLVKYARVWRLYLNTGMRRTAGLDVGDDATVTLEFDRNPEVTPMNPALAKALSNSEVSRVGFEALTPSRKKEILRYLNALRTPESLARNVENVVQHLEGKRPKGLHALLRVKG